jgi:hypothetical protein
MTKKLQRMNPNLTYLNPTTICSKKVPPKSPKLPHIYVRIRKVGFKVGFNPTKKRKNEHPCPPIFHLHLSWPYCEASAAAQQLLLHLRHHTLPLASHPSPPPLPPLICRLMLLLLLLSALLLPLRHQLSTASLQPPLSSKQPLLHLHHHPPLSPAVIVLCLCRRSFADCCFCVIVVSAVVAHPEIEKS